MSWGMRTRHSKQIYKCLYCCPLRQDTPSNVFVLGKYVRSCDQRVIKRYKCKDCGRSFSDATSTFEYRQRKRKVNLPLFKLLSSCISMRRSAIVLGIHRTTVDRKFRYLSKVCNFKHEAFLSRRVVSTHIQFDDMESSEHTKLKPVSIPLVVDAKTREILAWDVVQMPAKGPLAARSVRKYGYRKDERPKGWKHVLTTAGRTCVPNVHIRSDSHPRYPGMIQRHLPGALHKQVKGRRGCVTGQGELKVGGFDPLFSLNHTAAMNRANISRLVRKTWCNTKKRDRLSMHISIFALWHNETIRARIERRKPRYPF